MTSRRNGVFLGLGVLLAAGLGLGAAVGDSASEPSPLSGPIDAHGQEAAETPPITVETQSVVRVESFQVGRSFTGTVVARRTSELGFERSAKVVGVLVDQGQQVDKGQPLAILDTRQLEIERRRTTAERDQAAAILEELEAGPRRQTIDAARASLSEATAQVELQQRNFRRLKQLIAQNAASVEQFDAVELGLQSAEARRESAQHVLDELEAGSRIEKIQAQRAVVAQLDARLDDIDVDLNDSTLRAPFAGQISHRHVDEGTVVDVSQSVMKIVESGVLEAHIGLPADLFDDLQPAQRSNIVVGGRSFRATFDRALPEVDLQTRTRLAIFTFEDESDDGVVPGEVARVEIEQTEDTNGFWLPTTALTRSYRGLWAAYVVEQDGQGTLRVERRDVEVLHNDGSRALVRGTLSPGDRVITSGTHRVVPGQAVAL